MRSRPPALSLCIALVAACSVLQAPAERPPPPDLTFRHFEGEQYRGGALDWRATFGTLALERGTGQLQGTEVRLTPMSGDSTGARITASRGTGSLKTGVAHFEGGVSYDADGGDHAETSACTANFVSKTASGKEPVHMRGLGYDLAAAGFDGTFTPPTQIHLLGGVHALVDTKGDNPLDAERR